MSTGLIIVLAMVALIIAYTVVKVISYNRLRKEQWKDVDKSKLKEWDDDDNWD